MTSGQFTSMHSSLRRLFSEGKLMVMEESFPESSPLAVEVERARRSELPRPNSRSWMSNSRPSRR
ncbi:MAG: hypothetical protein ACP5XB_04685 [Isosphaeraceae bacterium]